MRYQFACSRGATACIISGGSQEPITPEMLAMSPVSYNLLGAAGLRDLVEDRGAMIHPASSSLASEEIR